MQRDRRYLIGAVALGACAVMLFLAAGFFNAEITRQTMLCSKWNVDAAECFANESSRVSIIALTDGIALCYSFGLIDWAIAVFLTFKWKRGYRITV